MNCNLDWKPKITPQGLCYELKMVENESYMSKNPHLAANNVLGLIIAVNLSDSTYGWHGYRAGLALYYFHPSMPQRKFIKSFKFRSIYRDIIEFIEPTKNKST